MEQESKLLLGCGILKKEVNYLIAKNNWPIQAILADSSLHIDFKKLSHSLNQSLLRYQEKGPLVFYGACHPLMDQYLSKANTRRTEGQNCVEMLLGNERFNTELENGAFFLLEDWANRWNYIIAKTFGDNPDIVREVFRIDRKYLLCINTPCSENFENQTEAAGELVGLPVRWLEVNLDHLEGVLRNPFETKNL